MHCKNTRKGKSRDGITLTEAIVVSVLLILLLICVLPMQSGHEAARRMRCANHLMQLGLALHNCHDMQGYFPAAMAGTDVSTSLASGNRERLSGLVAILPELEQSELYDRIVDHRWNSETESLPWQQPLEIFRCPSSSRVKPGREPTSYAFCIGDVASDLHREGNQRGIFGCETTTRFRDITDGMSNTILMGEIGTEKGLFTAGQIAVDQPESLLDSPSFCFETRDTLPQYYAIDMPLHPEGRGAHWADGAAGPGMFSTILPPNSPNCAIGGNEAVDGFFSAGSYHPGGTQVAFADGSVQFITDTIDVGDLTQTPPSSQDRQPRKSPFGVWGALGTRAGEESNHHDY